MQRRRVFLMMQICIRELQNQALIGNQAAQSKKLKHMQLKSLIYYQNWWDRKAWRFSLGLKLFVYSCCSLIQLFSLELLAWASLSYLIRHDRLIKLRKIKA